jgi:hypothetical protein
MSAAEGGPRSTDDRFEVQPSVSDAIEGELYRLEAECSPPTRTRLSALLRGLTRVVTFIVRPESMTAYATLAAAFAAFLAVKAAERQEKATFTSALYSKQVDLLANAEARLDAFSAEAGHLSSRYLPIGDGILRSDPQQAIDYTKISASFVDFLDAFDAMHVVYPREAELFLVFRIESYAERVMYAVNDIKDKETKMSTSAAKLTPEDERQLKSSYQNLHEALGDLRTSRQILIPCSVIQLREGRYIDGPAFQRCISGMLREQR